MSDYQGFSVLALDLPGYGQSGPLPVLRLATADHREVRSQDYSKSRTRTRIIQAIHIFLSQKAISLLLWDPSGEPGQLPSQLLAGPQSAWGHVGGGGVGLNGGHLCNPFPGGSGPFPGQRVCHRGGHPP